MRRDECALWFAQIIRPFRTGDLARISGASKEAVKKWKDGTSTARLDHVINLGQRINAIADAVEDEMKRPVDPRSILVMAQRIAATETGEQAILARALIRQITKGESDGT